MALTVLYDACVLYPAPLRDLLMRLALTRLFQARRTDEIHNDWARNVAANRPGTNLSASAVAATTERSGMPRFGGPYNRNHWL